jgi:hypothetical protein
MVIEMIKEKIWRKQNGLLATLNKGVETEVFVKESFPWSMPGEFLSLRDIDDNEVLLIESLEKDLDEDVKELLKAELTNSQFVLRIKEIEKIEEDVELRRFFVKTDQGKRQFQTKLEQWPEVLSDNVILIEDLAGDLFRIDNWKELDQLSRKHLSPYVS